MKNKQLLKIVLCAAVAFAMVFTPVAGSYSAFAEEQEVQSEDVSAEQTLQDEEVEAVETEKAEEIPADIDEESAEPAEEEVRQEDTKTRYECSGNGFKVTAILSDAGALPDDAKLTVKQIRKDSSDYNYDAYMKALNGKDGAGYTGGNTMLFDIAFIKDGTELEPQAGTVSVTFDFLDEQLSKKIGAARASDVSVVHLPLKDKVMDEYDTTAEAKDIDAGDVKVEKMTAGANDLKISVKDETVQFTTDGFSAFAMAAKAGLRAAATSSNLEDFLVDAKIEATKDDQGNYIIVDGSKYTIDLTFEETISLQFPNEPDADMTYALPEGLKNADGDSGTFPIYVHDGGATYEVKNSRFEVIDNVLHVHFNTEDPNFERLTAAANLSFNIAFEAEFNVEQQEILFTDGIKVNYQVDDVHEMSVTKKGSFNKKNDCIDYTIVIKSKGNNDYIYFQDDLTIGDYITGIKDGAVHFKSNKRTITDADAWYSGAGQYNGTITGGLRNMLDGEEVIVTYSVMIDPTKIPVDDEGKIVVDDLTNSVTVRSSDDQTGSKGDETTDIDYTPGITKARATGAASGDVLHWSITANPDAKVSIKGRKITDTIRAAAARYIEFSGEGIHVAVYKEGETAAVREYDVPWNDPALTSTDDFKANWTYTIPDTDTEPYKYIITYDTKVHDDFDRDSVFTEVNLYNDATIEGGGTPASNRGIIGPPVQKDRLEVTKVPLDVNLDEGTISWLATLSVPVEGLATAYVREIYPHTTIGGQNIYEPINQGTIKVTGLYEDDGERYTVNDTGTELRIQFYKGSGSQNRGLLPSRDQNTRRTIEIYVETKISKDWLEASGGKLELADHMNSINVDGVPGSSTVTVQEPDLDKTVTKAGTRKVGDADLPVYRYEVVLSHVTEDVNSVKDTFNTKLFEPYTPDDADDAWYVFGVRMKNTSTKELEVVKGDEPFSHRNTSYGMELTTNTASMPHYENSYDNYYPNYKLVYYLTVKDEKAYQELMDGAIGDEDNIYAIVNNAEWNDEHGESKIDYEYPGVKKELLTPQSELTKTNDDIWAEFKITANPSEQTLNGGKPIKLTDTAEHLEVDITSIEINGEKSWPGVSYDLKGNTMTYIIPDATKIVITYKARVQLTTIGDKGETIQVAFNNKVDMLGYDDEANKDAYRNNSGGGIASIPSIDLLKHESGDITKPIEGVKFQLFIEEGNKPVTDKDGKEVVFTTDADGKISVRGDMEKLGWTLQENVFYLLREIEAPDNYVMSNTDFRFKISKDGTSNHEQYIYHSGDTLNAGNYAMTGIDVEKIWSDGNNRHDADEVTVKLQQRIGGEDEEWSDDIRILNQDGEWATESMTAVLNKDNNWKYRFDDLPRTAPTGDNFEGADLKAEYQIVETAVNGKEHELVINGARYKDTTYDVSENGDDSKVTVTNIYVPDIEVSFAANKVFEHGKLDKDAMFTFSAFEVSDDGKLTPVATGSTSATGGESSKVNFTPIKYTLDDLKNEDGTFASSKVFKYVVKENVTGNTDGKGFDSKTNIQYDKTVKEITVTLSLNNNKLTASVDYGKGNKMVFTNSVKPPETGDPMDTTRYLAIMLASLLGILAAAFVRRRDIRG